MVKRKFGKTTKILKIASSWLKVNILRWESGRQRIRPEKQEDFCGGITLTYFVENCLNLS